MASLQRERMERTATLRSVRLGLSTSRSVKYGVGATAPRSIDRQMTGQESPDIPDRHVLPWNERKGQVLVDGYRVDFNRQPRDREQLFELARKVEDAAVLGVVERAHAERIADQRETLPLAVPPRCSERAIQRRQSVRTAAQKRAQFGCGGCDRRRQCSRANHQLRAVAMNAG